jgi:hypothetical protein
MEEKMFDRIDSAYYERRAQEEIEKANNTDNPCAKRAHLNLAAEYMEKMRSLKPQAT